MKLSVVLATFNRADVLQKNLDCFIKQSDKDFEIVVSIDGSSDDTVAILEKYQKKVSFELKWINTGLTNTYGLSVARSDSPSCFRHMPYDLDCARQLKNLICKEFSPPLRGSSHSKILCSSGAPLRYARRAVSS